MMSKRSVYLFIFSGFGIFGLIILLSGMRQGWFLPSATYLVHFENGEGLFVGTPVSISGLKAGSVVQVDLNSDNQVVVKIQVQRRFAVHIHEDSKAVLGRPFIIGERAISITPGTKGKPTLKEGAVINGEESLEITDMLSGGRLSPYFQTFSKLLEQLRIVIEGDGSKNTVTLIDLYKQGYTSLRSVENLAKEVTTIRRDFAVSSDTQAVMHNLAGGSSHLESVMNQMEVTLPALTKLTTQVVDVMPQLTKTLQETTFTLQAMQRSFILSGGVSKLKKEQEENKDESRSPASIQK